MPASEGSPADAVVVYRATRSDDLAAARDALAAGGIACHASWRPSAFGGWFPGRATQGMGSGEGEIRVARAQLDEALEALRAHETYSEARIRAHLKGVSHDLRRIGLVVLVTLLLALELGASRADWLRLSVAGACGVLALLELRVLLRRRA